MKLKTNNKVVRAHTLTHKNYPSGYFVQFLLNPIPQAFYQNGQTSVPPEVIFTNSVNERAMASLFLPPLSLNSLHLKTSLGPLPPPLPFIYHIFCPSETFHTARESHQSVTRRGWQPHRKLLIPAGVSPALENCQTQRAQCWWRGTIARTQINPAWRTENFIM